MKGIFLQFYIFENEALRILRHYNLIITNPLQLL
jgi:hypothetical protein